MVAERIIAVVIWAYVLLFAALLGSGLPGQIEDLGIRTESISVGISLVFWVVTIILFFGFALAGWNDRFATPQSGFLVQRFGAERVANAIRLMRPSMLLMVATGVAGVCGVTNTFLTTGSAASYCLSSYFLAVGAGHLYAFLVRKKGDA